MFAPCFAQAAAGTQKARNEKVDLARAAAVEHREERHERDAAQAAADRAAAKPVRRTGAGGGAADAAALKRSNTVVHLWERVVKPLFFHGKDALVSALFTDSYKVRLRGLVEWAPRMRKKPAHSRSNTDNACWRPASAGVLEEFEELQMLEALRRG